MTTPTDLSDPQVQEMEDLVVELAAKAVPPWTVMAFTLRSDGELVWDVQRFSDDRDSYQIRPYKLSNASPALTVVESEFSRVTAEWEEDHPELV